MNLSEKIQNNIKITITYILIIFSSLFYLWPEKLPLILLKNNMAETVILFFIAIIFLLSVQDEKIKPFWKVFCAICCILITLEACIMNPFIVFLFKR